MPIMVDMDDLTPGEFLLLLSLTKKTGKLSAVRKGNKILLGLKEGSIVYAAQPMVRERLGSVLINRGLVSEEQLYRALEIQREEKSRRLLGSILVDLGAISRDGLEGVIRSQFEGVIRELMSWDGGVMVFNRVDMEELDAIRIDPSEVILGKGLETGTLLAESLDRLKRPLPTPRTASEETDDLSTGVSRSVDLDSVAAALAEITASCAPGADSSVASMLAEGDSLSVSLTAEMTLAILGAASEVAKRGVLLLVEGTQFSGIGGFGETSNGRRIDGQSTLIPRHLPSLVLSAVEHGATVRRPLPGVGGDLHLIVDLGDPPSGDVVAVPLMVQDNAVAVMYVDGAASGEVGSTATLEEVMAEVGRTLEAARS